VTGSTTSWRTRQTPVYRDRPVPRIVSPGPERLVLQHLRMLQNIPEGVYAMMKHGILIMIADYFVACPGSRVGPAAEIINHKS
jgi:hypothetical protein